MKYSRLFAPLIFTVLALASAGAAETRRPNILLAIADDLSWQHLGAYGGTAVSTPAFDRVAKAGVLFANAIAGSPGCSPSRAALLTGRHTWMIEQAGTHASSFSRKYAVYPDLLHKAGYHVGMTGKGWGPGNWAIDGWLHNPAGPAYDKRKANPPYEKMQNNDYAANFAAFLDAKPAGRPFCFWYGAHEPHRLYEKGAGLKSGKRFEDVKVPPFLPDTPEVRSDLLDYFVEIEHFDRHLGRMLDLLAQRGELENTLVIVTADNGMAFPGAKARCYEYGIHVPLAIAWGARVRGGRTVEDVVGFVDLNATILEAAQVTPPAGSVGRSIIGLLESAGERDSNASRERAFAARERHSSSRHGNLGYPQRAVRTAEFLYIRNFAPERWPAGDPQELQEDGRPGTMHGGYYDIDRSPTLEFVVSHREDPRFRKYFEHAVAKRPAEELFDIRSDPGCMKNLAGDPAFASVRSELAAVLDAELRRTGDPRVTGNPEIWETYPRYSPIRKFPAP